MAVPPVVPARAYRRLRDVGLYHVSIRKLITPERCEMKPSFIQRLIGNRNLLKNHVGTRWVFVIGVIGQLVVAFVPYPLSILSPQLPLLTLRIGLAVTLVQSYSSPTTGG